MPSGSDGAGGAEGAGRSELPSSGMPQQQQQSSNRNNNGRRQGNRGGQQRRGNPRSAGNRRGVNKFEGREPALKGHIFDYTGERNADQFLKTMKEIKTHIGRTYTKYTGDFIEAIENLDLPDPAEPIAPAPTEVADFELWKVRI